MVIIIEIFQIVLDITKILLKKSDVKTSKSPKNIKES